MRRYLTLGAGGAALAFLAIAPVKAQTFSYFDTFDEFWQEYWDQNGYPGAGGPGFVGYVPAGWDTWNSMQGWQAGDPNEDNPRCFGGDYGWWGDGSVYGPWYSALNAAGLQNYAVPWSQDPTYSDSPIRFNLIHPAWNPNGRVASAWFVGDSLAPSSSPYFGGNFPRHWNGAYPMQLQTNSMKAAFDLSMRTGNNWCGQYSNGLWVAADAICFCVQPVSNSAPLVTPLTDPPEFYRWGGWLGVGGLPGFQIEFDFYPNGTDPGTYPGDQNNHVGLDVALRNPAGAEVASVKTNIDQGVPLAFFMQNVSDNNQPVHATVYYNDPTHGGLGVVQVYMKIRAADWVSTNPAVGPGTAPFSWGEGAGDPPDGVLVLEACVGAWPTQNAIFGFTAATGGCNAVMQVDNVAVETDAVAPGVACTPPFALDQAGQPAWNPGSAVPLTAAPVGTSPTVAGLSDPGWLCRAYPILTNYWNFGDPAFGLLTWMKGSIQYCDTVGLGGAGLLAPRIDHQDLQDGGSLNLGYKTEFPGMPWYDDQWFGMLYKGFVYFPSAGNFSLDVQADDAFEVLIGDQVVLSMPSPTTWGSGINGGVFANLAVSTPGVYPIQVIYYEGYGGAECEFYRRTNIPLMPYVAIGADNSGLADQPVVYALMNGAEWPTNLNAAGTPAVWGTATVNLDTNQKMGDVNTASGDAALTLTKLVYGPLDWYNDGGGEQMTSNISYAISAWGGTNGKMWMDFLPNQVSGTDEVGVLQFGWNYYWTEDMGLGEFPGNPNHLSVGARFDGFLVFPAAGDYWIGMCSEDSSYMWIGQQLIYATESFDEPGKICKLVVPSAGVYPVRVESYASRNQRILTLYQVTPGHSKVLVNDPWSTIKFSASCSAGSYAWPTASRVPVAPFEGNKVANVGQGGTPGWNATLTKFTDGAVDIFYIAQAAMWYKNNIAYPTQHGLETLDATRVVNTAVVPAINFWTQGDDNLANNGFAWRCCEGIAAGFLPRFYPVPYLGDTFPAISTDPTVDENRFAMTFTGYIEFASAGDYAINGSTSDGLTIWIGGEEVTEKSWTNGWPYDANPALFHVNTPGIYDIRVDYFQQYYNVIVDLFMYFPDGSTALINSPQAAAGGVTVYSSLATAPSTTIHQDPTILRASGKVAELSAGGVPGYHIMQANETLPADTPDTSRAFGYDRLTDLRDADRLLNIVFEGAASTPSFSGTVGADFVTGQADPLFLCPDCGAPGGAPFPGIQRDHIAIRVNGYIALTAGGHMLSVVTDDGNRLVIGGTLVEPETVPVSGGGTLQVFKRMVGGQNFGSVKLNGGTNYADVYYVYVEADGIYPFEITFQEGWGGAALVLREEMNPLLDDGNAMEADFQYPNWGTQASHPSATFTKVFATLCNTPWADTDGDHDVDETDFGLIQACFTGGGGGALSSDCACLDRGGTPGQITIEDLTAFMNCFSGPAVPWTSSVSCP